MARRRRLNPAQTPYLSSAPAPVASGQPALRAGLGVAPPIAQVAGEASAVAALREVSAVLEAAKAEGRLLLRLPLAAVEADYLVRDRLVADADDMAQLVASIAEHGQRQPIEVAELGPGRYGLISGWRRLQALARLADGDGARFGTVLAQLRYPDTAASAYVAMIEENEIRVGLSYYERARVTAKAVETGVFPTEKAALRKLFSAASRARRSKIGSFLAIHRHLDAVLRFPAALPERLGLSLARLLEAEPALARPLVVDLAANPAKTATAEQSRLARFVVEQPRTDALEPVLSGTEPLSEIPVSGKLDPDTSGVGLAGPITADTAKATNLANTSEKQTRDTAGSDTAGLHGPATAAPDLPPLPPPDLAPDTREIRAGLFLRLSGGWTNPTLELSGPALDPMLRDRLEAWLTTSQ